MAQSLSNVLVHAVFGTFGRARLITRSVQPRMHRYLSGVLTNHGCQSLQVGGVEDHVHLLFLLSRTMTIAQVIEKVKTASNTWMKDEWQAEEFAWQGGYGAFSVSERDKAQVMDYIKNQPQHHHRRTFEEELATLSQEHGISYDKRHFWS